jgi:hypothetical protein
MQEMDRLGGSACDDCVANKEGQGPFSCCFWANACLKRRPETQTQTQDQAQTWPESLGAGAKPGLKREPQAQTQTQAWPEAEAKPGLA